MEMILRFLVFIWFVIMVVQCAFMKSQLDDFDVCSRVVCKAGRECVLHGDGSASCECMERCPDHHHPVCGTDNKSYENHCLLHREACLQEKHLNIQHKGYCKTHTTHANEVEKKKKGKPAMCLQHLDAMREEVVIWLQERLSKGGSKGKQTITSQDMVFVKFYMCDKNQDSYLDAGEFINCTTMEESSAEESQLDVRRIQCADSMIHAMDKNRDTKLDYGEFQKWMSPALDTKTNECSLEGTKYKNGVEVTVECNKCICSDGDWVCTTEKCTPRPAKTIHARLLSQDEDSDEEWTSEEEEYKTTPKPKKAKKVVPKHAAKYRKSQETETDEEDSRIADEEWDFIHNSFPKPKKMTKQTHNKL